MYDREESEIKIKSEIERVIFIFSNIGSLRFDIRQKLRSLKNELVI